MADCIEWTGYREKGGYGRLFRKGRVWQAHRWEWTEKHGPIPEGMCVLHRCDNPPCVNVAHLFLGTQVDNIHDMIAKGRRRTGQSERTHCKRGHEFTASNTKITKEGWRQCRACLSMHWRRAYARRKAA